MISQVLVAAGLLSAQAADSGSSGQNYQQYQKDYAGGQNGDYQQYMKKYGGGQSGNYQHYMSSYAGGHSGDYQQYMKKYAGGQGGDYQQYMKKYTGGQGGDYQQYMQKYAGGSQGGSQSNADSATPLNLDATASNSHGNYQQYMDKYAGSYKKYMNQYAGDYQKYQNYQKYKDCDSVGKVRSAKDANTTAQLDEWYKGAQKQVTCYVPDGYSASKYASEAVDKRYKSRLAELNNGGSQSSDEDYASPLELMGLDTNLDATATKSKGNYQQYMDKYAGSYEKYMKQYAGDYQKYQNYQKYKDCDSFGKVRRAKDANTTAQLDEWYKGAKQRVTCYVPDAYSASKYASQEVHRQYKSRLAQLNKDGTASLATRDSSDSPFEAEDALELVEKPPAAKKFLARSEAENYSEAVSNLTLFADQVNSDPMTVVGACSLGAAFAFFVFFAVRRQRSVQLPVAQLG